jgi:hypothetical protein
VPVPDDRLAKLAALEKSEKIVPTTIEFVDIAGLVKGASTGEGLGNKFLSHIREVDAIMEVVRFFENKDIIHVQGNVDPKRDMETVAIELQLADLQNVENRLSTISRQAKSGDREAIVKKIVLDKYRVALEKGQMANTVHLTDEEKEHSKDIQLLTNKPFLFVANSEFNLDKKEFVASVIPSAAEESLIEGGTTAKGSPSLALRASPNPFSNDVGLPDEALAKSGRDDTSMIVIDAQL